MTESERQRLHSLEVLAILLAKAFRDVRGSVSDYKFWFEVFKDQSRLEQMVDYYLKKRKRVLKQNDARRRG